MNLWYSWLKEQASKNSLIYLDAVTGKLDKRDVDYYEQWLSEKKHGSMHYLENHRHCREDPRFLLNQDGDTKLRTSVLTCLLFAYPYGYRRNENSEGVGDKIALYARGKDYHKFMSKNLKLIAQDLFAKKQDLSKFRVVVDSAPLLERALFKKGFRGFIGKNTLFIHTKWGSFLSLGCLLIEGDYAQLFSRPIKDQVSGLDTPDFTKAYSQMKEQAFARSKRDPILGGCGSCQRCKNFCPTNALQDDYRIDATKCLTYWTVEQKSVIPYMYWKHLKNHIFGCDICQKVCPYNRSKDSYSPPKTLSYSKKLFPNIWQLATLDQETYLKYFAGTALTRAGINGLIRNALIHMCVSKDPKTMDAVKHHQRHSDNQMVLATCEMVRNYKDFCANR